MWPFKRKRYESEGIIINGIYQHTEVGPFFTKNYKVRVKAVKEGLVLYDMLLPKGTFSNQTMPIRSFLNYYTLVDTQNDN